MLDEPAAEAIRRIDDWERTLEERAAQAKALARRAAELSATVRSDDGLIEVTVGRDGQLDDLRLDERIRNQPAATTARRILETQRAAKADLIRQFEEVAAETVGTAGETGRALMASMRARLGRPDGPVDERRGSGPVG